MQKKLNRHLKLLCTLLFILLLVQGQLLLAGPGFLQQLGNQQILYLKGSPREIGFQHGLLLSDQISINVTRFAVKNFLQPREMKKWIDAVPEITKNFPPHFIQEMRGIAEGSGIPYQQIVLLNLFPELFPCSAMTMQGMASLGGTQYHVRMADDVKDEDPENPPILFIVCPDKGYNFASVGYAGFIGVLTGINSKKIALSKIFEKQDTAEKRITTSFLMREVLQNSASLEQVYQLLNQAEKLLEYFSIFSDGKTGGAVGANSTPEKLHFIFPGSCSLDSGINNLKEICLPEDTLILCSPDRYQMLFDSIIQNYGKIDASILEQIIQNQANPCSNAHHVIFAPESLELWLFDTRSNPPLPTQNSYRLYDLTSMFNKLKDASAL